MRTRATQLLPALLLCALTHPLPTLAQTDQAKSLEDLKHLFETDPAAAFVKASAMFEEPKAKGDLEGMMAIIGLTSEWAERCAYLVVLDDMVDAAVPLAKAQGKWQLLGDAYTARAAATYAAHSHAAPVTALGPRMLHALDMAQEAYARAGKSSAQWANLKGGASDYILQLLHGEGIAREKATWAKQLGAQFAAAHGDIVQAVIEVRDAEGARLARDLLATADASPSPVRDQVLFSALCQLVWVRGMESLLPELVGRAEKGGGWYWLVEGCAARWGGADDEWYRTMWLGYRRRLEAPSNAPVSDLAVAHKLRAFHRPQDLGRMAELFLGWLPTAQFGGLTINSAGVLGLRLVHPDMPADLRARLLGSILQRLPETPEMVQGSVFELSGLGNRFGPEWWRQWAPEALPAMTQAVLACRIPGGPGKALADIAALYDRAEMPREAEQTRELAQRFGAKEPATLLQCALTSARALAASGKWEEAAEALEEATKAAPEPSPELLQAAILLHEAYLRLAKPAEADLWLTRALDLVNTLPLPPAEKANYLLTLANLCDLAAQAAAPR